MSNKQNITQKEWLDFLDQLHNKLRSAKGIKLTQMKALNEISNFMLFRFLDSEKIVGIKIPKDDRMKKMYEKYATDEKIKEDGKTPVMKDRNCYKLWHEVYNVNGNENCLILKYIKNENFAPYLKSTTDKISAYISSDKGCVVIQQVINIIYKKFENIDFDTKFFDLFGSAYEEFKMIACGNSGKTGKKGGTAQHFTNVYIKKLIINELVPKHNEIFYEPCAGSGGFIHTADHYVLEKEGGEKSNIFKKNIFANECNPEIFRPLILNMLFHNIPISDKDDCNIKEEDSLSNENILNMYEKCDLIATNFPFGMNTDLEPNEKTKFCWEVLKSGKEYIKNSSGQFVLHIYHSLKKNGRTGFVSDRGILNNGCDNPKSWESRLRKFMFENTNVYKIVLLPKGSFTYTSFATCIVFFKKGEKTKECNIYEAKFKVPKDLKSEIYIDDKPIKTFSIKELQENNYNLGLNEKEEEDIREGKWIDLDKIINFDIGGTPKTDNNEYWNGDLNWVSIKELNGKEIFNTEKKITQKGVENSPVKLVKKGSIMMSFKLSIGKFGIAGKDMYCNEAIMFFDHENKIIKKFIEYCLKIIPISENLLNGNIGNGSLNKKTLGKIQIPDLSLDHQQEIVDFLDKQFEQYNIEQLTPYTKDIKLFDLLIYKKYDFFADALHIIYRKIEADVIHKKFDLDKKAIFNMRVNQVESKECKLGDIVEKLSLKATKFDKTCENGKYPFYNCSILNHLYTNVYNYDDEVMIINTTNGSGKCKIYYNKGKFSVGTDVFVFKCKNNTNIQFIFSYIKNNIELVNKLFVGQDKKHLYWKDFSNLPIKLPSIQDQQKIIEEIEKVESEQSSYANYTKILEEQIKNMNITIKNICALKNKPKEEDKEDTKGKTKEKVKKDNNKKKVESSSSSSNDSSDDTSSESEKEDKKTKPKEELKTKSINDKKVKKEDKKKKIESESESSDSSSSESEKEKKKKNSKSQKNTKKKESSSESDSFSSESSSSLSSESEKEKTKNKSKVKK
jgi:type I restriction-modification system DNA methylase subunit/restriction endonuclease S subunit